MTDRLPKLPMTRKEFKKAWLRALRGGGYRQGTGQLTASGDDVGPRSRRREYCCLGVAARILGLLDIKTGDCSYAGSTEGCLLPLKLREQLGISERLQSTLINSNDGIWRPREGFRKIARHIEEGYNP